MDANDIDRLASTATDLFRLETLPTYAVDDEAEDLAAWRAGHRILATPDEDAWLAKIRTTTAAGARWSRARVLDYPLTEYSRFELYGYQANAAAGERIYVADRASSPELAGLHDDVWIFDHTVVVRMIYDAAGRFVGAEQSTDIARFSGMRAVALRHAMPLHVFLATNEPGLVA